MESFGYSLVQVLASMLRLFSLMLVIYAVTQLGHYGPKASGVPIFTKYG